MSAFTRGAKNAFRNPVRTMSVTIILAMSIGLALIMLLANRTVQARIDTVKSTIGNTITIMPAGARGFDGGGEPLTEKQIDELRSLDHVSQISATLVDRLSAGKNTSLASAIESGTLGNRQIRFNVAEGSGQAGVATKLPENVTFTIPILITGISDPASLVSESTKLAAGELFDGSKDENVALVGQDLATKNNLSAGSTFTAYNTSIIVKGILDSDNRFNDSGLYMPMETLQRLSEQSDQVSSATVSVDSITNLDATVTAIKQKLGADKADVVSNEEASKQALNPLENIKNISFYSLIGALAAGSIITLLTMVMIVRERRKEIGVLKAIGASNISVVSQFVSESLVLTLLSSVVGIVLGVALSNPVLKTLVNTSVSTSNPIGGGAGGPVQVMRVGLSSASQVFGGVQSTVRDLQAVVGFEIVLYGLLVAVLIAVIGSALPAWLIAQVRPAEVMRGE